ncbi:MAG: MBL fold metallo-hydrolase, partial [Gemmatimonadota bacterium]|nr:MBL fold metallo-hydrolase [Gemmatimonadota bacterium]
ADIRVRPVDAGSLRLDGGAMFGVVPKPLWSRRAPADGRNRISLAMRCLLVETSGARILVDTGLGSKEDAKFLDIYGVRNEGRPSRLEDALRDLGVEPGDIDIVVNTHLHFDHAGGNTVRGPGGVRPAFPGAEYVIDRGEFDWAHSRNERVRASYLPDNFDPLVEHGRVRWLDEDEQEIVPGVRAVRTPGHTPFHRSIRIELGERTLFYLADLVPTAAHLPLPWIMGYDVEPLVTLESKRRWLGRAADEGWLLAFEHDPFFAWGWAGRDERGRPVLERPVEHPIGERLREERPRDEEDS